MSLPNWITNAFTEIAHTMSAVGAFLAALLGWSNRKKIQEVHLTVNSRLDELIKTTKEKAHAEGRVEGIESEQQRMRPADPSPPPPK
jgi:hypothetical protein